MDIAKYQLLEQCAQERGVKTSTLARDAVYEWLSRNVDAELFEAANMIDDATWKQSVRNLVSGRKQNKSSSSTNEQQADSDK
ncbi:hypothetical protein KBY58_12155 [Cyanobium sp. HWJ4-Hawea]|nr:hypothetical protein [Cyanobium sp. HWJ4-Hawea]